MSSQSTPINQLRKEDNTELVNKILGDMETGNQQSSPQQPQFQDRAPEQQQQQQQYYDEEEYFDEYPELPMSTTDMIMHEGKAPLLVALIILLFGFSFVDQNLMKYVSRLGTDGQLNIMGMLLKAVLGAALFYGLNRFV